MNFAFLDDLPDRARLAVDDLELPELFLVQLTEGHFRLVCRAKRPGWGHVMVGILRVMADDYGALACFEHRGLHNQTETVDIMLIETSYAKGRSFVLGQRPVQVQNYFSGEGMLWPDLRRGVGPNRVRGFFELVFQDFNSCGLFIQWAGVCVDAS